MPNLDKFQIGNELVAYAKNVIEQMDKKIEENGWNRREHTERSDYEWLIRNTRLYACEAIRAVRELDWHISQLEKM